MNAKQRAEKYLQAKQEFDTQLQLYTDRLDRAREIVYAIWRKQYTSKISHYDLRTIDKFYPLFHVKNLVIDNIDYSDNINRMSIKLTEKYPAIKLYAGKSVIVDSVLVFGSDRDIAKMARREFDNYYAYQFKCEIVKDLGKEKKQLENQIKRAQDSLDTILTKEQRMNKQYENLCKHREAKLMKR